MTIKNDIIKLECGCEYKLKGENSRIRIKSCEEHKPKMDIEKEKENIKKQIQAECERLILEKYPLHRQRNIGIFGTNEERQEFENYTKSITSQFHSFNSQVDKIKTEKTIKEYSFEFKEKGE